MPEVVVETVMGLESAVLNSYVPTYVSAAPKPVPAASKVPPPAVSKVNVTFRPSAAVNTKPCLSSCVLVAVTPVCADKLLMAVVIMVRLISVSLPNVTLAVVKPLIVTVPAAVDADIAEPKTVVCPTVAVTPLCADTRLIAAAFAIALDAIDAGVPLDSWSSVAKEAPTTVPFNTRSPLANAGTFPVVAPIELKEALGPKPMSLVCTESKPMFMVSPLVTPVCNLTLPAEPSNNLILLWLVVVATLLICCFIWSTSNCND